MKLSLKKVWEAIQKEFQKKAQKEHKKSLSITGGPDSTTSRAQGAVAGSLGSKNKKGLGGKDIQQMLDIEDEGMESTFDRNSTHNLDAMFKGK